uniref:Uncharacterized protein n=1 Tax=Solanum tuberosum TaxID=4113 RepID=M1DB01_SOLTU
MARGLGCQRMWPKLCPQLHEGLHDPWWPPLPMDGEAVAPQNLPKEMLLFTSHFTARGKDNYSYEGSWMGVDGVIADPLSDPPFGQFHGLFPLAFSNFKFCNFRRYSTASQTVRRLLLSIADLIFSFKAWYTGTLCETMAIRRLAEWFRGSSSLLFFVLSATLFLFAHLCTCFVPQPKYLKIKDLH